jgi:SAM-dependent methyltransferase
MSAGSESLDDHFERADVVGEYASFDELFGAEQKILDELEPSLAGATVLDLGVGGGRTALHLIGRVATYTGVDYSQSMVDACWKRFDGHQHPGVTFQVGDARHMPEIPDRYADLVLFSFNGLDGVGDRPERTAALAEMARVCKPGGTLALSSDNLLWTRGSISVRRVIVGILTSELVRDDPLVLLRRRRLLLRAARDARRRRELNTPVERLAARYAMVVEERPRYELDAHGFDSPNEPVVLTRYSTEPGLQVDDLVAAGFSGVRVFTPGGEELTNASPRGMARWRWLYYACRRTAEQPPA